MEEKNELNDLFLGEENKNGGSKKLFLIIAGALLVFFVTIGIMKFVNSDEDKNQSASVAKPAAVAKDKNTSADVTAVPNDEKLNEIVRKLQEDAKNQAMQPSALDNGGNVTAQPQQVAVPTQQAQKPQPAPAPAPVVQAPKPAPVVQVQKPAPAPVVQVQKPAPVQVQPSTPKEVLTKATAPAPAQVSAPVAPKPKPKPKPVVAQKAKVEPKAADASTAEPEASGGKAIYVQIGYFDSKKNVDSLTGKASAAGFKTITKQAQVNGKEVTKILVGPFSSDSEAKSELAKVRQQVKGDAFLVK